MRPILNLLIILPFFLASCDPIRFYHTPPQVEGYTPVYSADMATLKQIKGEAARTTVNGGKIYTTGNLLFQVEIDSGIHVINYANPSNPQKLGFIKSFLCKEVAVKNGFIYSNNFSDLVVIDINNLNSIREVSRTAGVFPDLALQYPPKSSASGITYFECPDPSKGIIIGWKKQTLNHPKCWR